MKWLKPALNYSANYRWSDDLTREGQNISTQLRFGSNFSITPSQIIELVYKPKSGSNNRNSNRSRNSRNRTRNRSNNSRIKVEEIKENKVKFKPMIFIHSMFKKDKSNIFKLHRKSKSISESGNWRGPSWI